MWIPYFIFEFWQDDSTSETISASNIDNQMREFEIGFFLENPPTRRRAVEIELKNPEKKMQTDGTGRQVTVQFQPNSKNQLEVIIFRLTDSKPKNAFIYCYNNVSQLLSFWALATGSGFSILRVYIVDIRHNAKWIIEPQWARPGNFFLPSEINISPKHAAMLSLYREARNSQSPFYKFLCCYKILEVWYKKGDIFATADRLVREKNLPFRRPRKKITQQMLIMSLVFNSHPEFKGMSFVRFFKSINPWRTKIAHVLTDVGEFINFDKYESQIEFGPIANLTDLVARQVLLDEFHLWGQIASAGITEC